MSSISWSAKKKNANGKGHTSECEARFIVCLSADVGGGCRPCLFSVVASSCWRSGVTVMT